MEALFDEVQFVLEDVTLPWLNRFESRKDALQASANGTLKANVFRSLLWEK